MILPGRAIHERSRDTGSQIPRIEKSRVVVHGNIRIVTSGIACGNRSVRRSRILRDTTHAAGRGQCGSQHQAQN